MEAWRGWLHCTGSTYGAWLRGDPRGWRSLLHREHCEGDYRSPPTAGEFDAAFRRSRELMKRDGVELDLDSRGVACDAMVEALRYYGVHVIAVCVGRRHWHVLARFPVPGKWVQGEQHLRATGGRLWRNRIARHWLGNAKRVSARKLSDQGLCARGGVWASGCGVKPVRDRKHQLSVVRYILNHLGKGAVTWSVATGFAYPKGGGKGRSRGI